jgi:hypothetical protein
VLAVACNAMICTAAGPRSAPGERDLSRLWVE